MEYFVIRITEHSVACANIIEPTEGGYRVEYRGMIYWVYGHKPGDEINLVDLRIN